MRSFCCSGKLRHIFYQLCKGYCRTGDGSILTTLSCGSLEIVELSVSMVDSIGNRNFLCFSSLSLLCLVHLSEARLFLALLTQMPELNFGRSFKANFTRLSFQVFETKRERSSSIQVGFNRERPLKL